MAALSHIDHWIFDLDNTLYPPALGLFDQIGFLQQRRPLGLQAFDFVFHLSDAQFQLLTLVFTVRKVASMQARLGRD